MDLEHDHRRLGRELRLFDTSPTIGAGLPFWLPDGAVIRSELERLGREVARRTGCREVYTPVLGKRELYERSGHLDKFADDMFPPMNVGGEEFMLRPANCPHHALVYAADARSYRDLPIRLHELAPMFRSELSGVLGGLSRVRQISLDDTHVFCQPDQVADEVERGLAAIGEVAGLLGVEVAAWRLSVRDSGDGWLGTASAWQRAEADLAAALEALGLPYERVPGEAAFYGPKVDVEVVDAGGRSLTLSTVQLDFAQPERFDLTYTADDGTQRRPVMIHRGLISSMERMAAYLIERFGGRMPPWLAPCQVVVLPVTPEQRGAAEALAADLPDLRVEVEHEGSLGKRMRAARLRRAPWVCVIGEREASAGIVEVHRPGAQARDLMPAAEFVSRSSGDVRRRSLEPT